MKTEHHIGLLIGVGAIVVLYILWKESQAKQTDASVSPPVTPSGYQPPVYPNGQPINLGNVTINDAPAPPFQLYNGPSSADFPTVGVDDLGTAQSSCGCQEVDCDAAGVPVTFQHIPASVFKRAASNLHSYISKVGQPLTSGVEAARATFRTGAVPPVPTGGSLYAA